MKTVTLGIYLNLRPRKHDRRKVPISRVSLSSTEPARRSISPKMMYVFARDSGKWNSCCLQTIPLLVSNYVNAKIFLLEITTRAQPIPKMVKPMQIFHYNFSLFQFGDCFQSIMAAVANSVVLCHTDSRPSLLVNQTK